MKVGLSYSRCLREIIEGKVHVDDVLVIIARTDFDPEDDKQWKNIWDGYSGRSYSASFAEWANSLDTDEQKYRDLTIELYKSGKLFQPRQHGGWPQRREGVWLETFLPSVDLENNPAVKTAWENFLTVAGLTGVTMDKDYK